jgi:4-hydroxy-3-methylbut-2-enyl diphosphate reductase IspH
MEVLLADEFGFCFGVERAEEKVVHDVVEGAPVRPHMNLIVNTLYLKRM